MVGIGDGGDRGGVIEVVVKHGRKRMHHPSHRAKDGASFYLCLTEEG